MREGWDDGVGAADGGFAVGWGLRDAVDRLRYGWCMIESVPSFTFVRGCGEGGLLGLDEPFLL